MNSKEWEKIETIVDEVLENNVENWREYVEKTCSDDPQIKSEVTKLLESIFNSEGWLESSDTYEEYLVDGALGESAVSLQGETFGAYQATELIAEGGMGAVYLGERGEGDFDHTVAIKVIKAGMGTPDNIRRFNRERSILAGLKHEGIAQLYDGGISENGSPYLIMEYVEGARIDEYCRENQLTLQERTDLFKQVLNAVMYAHENLVIHRDLKPGNILVTNSGKVKILDFGIAKLLDEDDASEKYQNITRARILTPKYAAPEQILQSSVTTATDIYTLGVIFYDLVTGKHPFDIDGLSQFKIEQRVLENEPPRPSARALSAKQKKELQGDLDAVALKAIRKKPEFRYRTAKEFMDDLNRFQEGLPVTARENTVQYRFQKFFKRHRKSVATVTGVLLLIIGFLGFYTHQITQERDLAEQQLNKAEQIREFLISVFNANDPSENNGEEITALELLNNGLNEVDALADPSLQAEMYIVIGEAYQSLGYADIAAEVMDKGITAQRNIYGDNSLEYAGALYKRGLIELETQNDDFALPYFREAYQIRSEKLPVRDFSLIDAKMNLAKTLRNTGKIDSSVVMMSEIIAEIDPSEYQETAIHKNRLRRIYSSMAYILREKGNLEEAEHYYREAINLLEIDGKEIDLRATVEYNNLAFVYRDLEDFESAKEYLQKSLNINEQIRGEGHPTTSIARSNLAGILLKQQNLDGALKLYLQNLEHTEKYYGRVHWRTASKHETAGRLYMKLNEYLESRSHLEQSVEIYKKTLGEDHIWTSVASLYLATVLYLIEDQQHADSLFGENIANLYEKKNRLRPVTINMIEKVISNLEEIQHIDFNDEIVALKDLHASL